MPFVIATLCEAEYTHTTAEETRVHQLNAVHSVVGVIELCGFSGFTFCKI